jgi:hypothetical protein
VETAAVVSGCSSIEPNGLGRPTGAGESPVGDRWLGVLVRHLSTAGHEESRGKLGGPPSKAKYSRRPIANSTVRER